MQTWFRTISLWFKITWQVGFLLKAESYRKATCIIKQVGLVYYVMRLTCIMKQVSFKIIKSYQSFLSKCNLACIMKQVKCKLLCLCHNINLYKNDPYQEVRYLNTCIKNDPYQQVTVTSQLRPVSKKRPCKALASYSLSKLEWLTRITYQLIQALKQESHQCGVL